MLSQFTKEAEHHQTLAELYPFPKSVYAVGRLDKDSEGLLILTDDKKLNARLLHPHNRHERTYLVQIEGSPEPNDLADINSGIEIKVNKKIYKTLPARFRLLADHPDIPERNPPVRYRKNTPTSFVLIALKEGKNRQVRKMFAKMGYPVLRLIRMSIENLELKGMQPRQVQEMSQKTLFGKLFS